MILSGHCPKGGLGAPLKDMKFCCQPCSGRKSCDLCRGTGHLPISQTEDRGRRGLDSPWQQSGACTAWEFVRSKVRTFRLESASTNSNSNHRGGRVYLHFYFFAEHLLSTFSQWSSMIFIHPPKLFAVTCYSTDYISICLKNIFLKI